LGTSATLLLAPGFQTLATLWATFSSKMESLRKREKVLRIGKEGERKNGGRVKM